jgi:hypothetical protein
MPPVDPTRPLVRISSYLVGGAARPAWAGRVAVLAAALALAPDAGAAQVQVPIDAARAAAYLEEAAGLAGEDGGRLWGVSLAGPLLFVDPATRAAVASHPDDDGVLAAAGGVYAGTLPREVMVANTAAEWGGRRWTMIVWPPPGDRHERRRLVAHEMFHRVQPELGLPLADPPSPHLATAAGRAWLRLEWRALARALRACGAERAEAVGDALVFRAYRRALFPGAAAAEGALELSEGLAEYTGARLDGRPAEALGGWAAGRLEAFEARESLVRSFAYASGPAYGLLLDAADAGWRAGLPPDADLGALLARAHGLPHPAVPAEAEARRRAVGYGGAAVEAAEAERAAALEARDLELRARFVEGPRLVLPMAGEVGFRFDPSGAVVLPEVGTVYEEAEVSAAWGILAVERGGVLFLRTDAGFGGVVVPAAPGPDGPPPAGDGWRLELAEGWSVVPGNRPGEWTVARTVP